VRGGKELLLRTAANRIAEDALQRFGLQQANSHRLARHVFRQSNRQFQCGHAMCLDAARGSVSCPNCIKSTSRVSNDSAQRREISLNSKTHALHSAGTVTLRPNPASSVSRSSPPAKKSLIRTAHSAN